MKAKVLSLLLLFVSFGIIQASYIEYTEYFEHEFAEQIDSIRFTDFSNEDSILCYVYSTINGGFTSVEIVRTVEDEELKILLQYSQDAQADCYCSIFTSFKIEKNQVNKMALEVLVRYRVGGTEEAPVYSHYRRVDLRTQIPVGSLTNIRNQASNIAIYPNPADKFLTVDTGDDGIAELNIFNIYGVPILNRTVKRSEIIDLAFLPKGIYFVKWNDRYFTKLIKK
jgi:hypothetical protein